MSRHFAVLSVAVLAALAAPASSAPDQPTPVAKPLAVPSGFEAVVVARIPRARELAALPNGDLLVGTAGSEVMIVPHADDAGGAEAPAMFAQFDDHPGKEQAAGVTYADDTIFVGTQFGVWRIPYTSGDRKARSQSQIAKVRTSDVSSDHVTTSVAVSRGIVYASVGSSCNVCDPELDATRATVQMMKPDGSDLHPKAVHIRNAIALATNPNTGTVWAGVAGQDELAKGHPYEVFDPVSLHPGTADYGWPLCYEDHKPVKPGIDCSKQIVPRVVMYAYMTPIGAAIYPKTLSGPYAFPAKYRGGAFVGFHGSWHVPHVAPRVVFVPLDGDEPVKPVDWNDPTAQWSDFFTGFTQEGGQPNTARPTGVAISTKGTLFVADDAAGVVYRIRPTHA
jgi:glucose/arabinose dehydrogenase